mgnify:CR=1 FL=1
MLPSPRLMLRLSHPCPYVADMPRAPDDPEAELLELPASGIVQAHPALEEKRTYAEIRLGWNEKGLGIQLTVTGKRQALQGDQERPGSCDGLHLWLATRPVGSSRRATRYCHHLILLATGCGPERDQPGLTAQRIPRALHEAPLPRIELGLIRRYPLPTGHDYRLPTTYDYRLQAFLPAAALPGYDPEESPHLGFFYLVRDHEHGDQFLALDWNFPIGEDPALWDQLHLIR